MEPTIPIFVLVLVSVSVIALLVIQAIAKGMEFDDNFPPISDADFVAKCSPDVRPEVALRVRRIIADNLGINYDRIHPSMRFKEDIAGE